MIWSKLNPQSKKMFGLKFISSLYCISMILDNSTLGQFLRLVLNYVQASRKLTKSTSLSNYIYVLILKE